MPSAKRANKAGPSNASSSSSSSSSTAPRSAKTATTVSPVPPSKRVIASLRRLPSQLLSAFASSSSPSSASSSSKAKRKAEERERDLPTSTPRNGKARARDPPFDTPTTSSAVLVADESSASPAQKRARIAAPEALGREESRRLLALLDSPARSEHDWQMISVEEDDAGASKRLEQDPLEDDDEVAGLLGETGTNTNGEGSRKSEAEALPETSAAGLKAASPDATEPSSQSNEVNGVEKELAESLAGELQESEIVQHEVESEPQESASAAVSEQPAEGSAKEDVAARPREGSPAAQAELPIAEATSGHSEAGAGPGSTHSLSEQADISMEAMLEEVSAPVSSATFPSQVATTNEPPVKPQEVTKEEEQPEEADELPASMPELERLEAADSMLASGLKNDDMTTDAVALEADEAPNNASLKAMDRLPEDTAGSKQAAETAARPSPDGQTLEANGEAQGEDLFASASPFEAPAKLQPNLQEASLPLSPPIVNGHVDTPPSLYPALPMAADLDVTQNSSNESPPPSEKEKEETLAPGVRVASADALTEDVEPVESEMLEAEHPSFEREIVDAVFGELDEGAEVPDKAEEDAAGAEQEAILIPVLPQSAEDASPSAEDGVAAHTMELGEAEDIIVPSDTETEAPESRAPEVVEIEAGEGDNLDGNELDEVDEEDVEDEGIDELDEGSLLPTNPAVEVIDFTAEDSSDDEEEILVPLPQSKGSSTAFNRTPSSGLLRGPLSQRPRAAMSPVSNADSSVSDTIRALGRATLDPRSPSSASSMSAMFDAQRYHKPVRKVTPSSHPAMAKRPHIFEASHKARVRGKAQKEIGALKVIFQKNAVWLSRKGFKTSEQLGGWLEYKKLLGERISTTTGPAREKTAVLQLLNNDGSDLERKLRRLLGKSATSDSRISIKPGKEQKRLRREALAKERLRRGILGRPPLPKTLTPEQEAQVAAVLSDYSWKVSVPGATASNRDVAMLRPGQWMNDETITFYMTMINQRSTRAEEERAKPSHDKRWNAFYRVHAFNSHFWAKIDQVGHSAVARWTRKVDVFSKDLILVPCNLGNSHWTCAAVNFRRKRIEYYDSMAGENRRVTSKLREYLKKEMADKKKDGVIDLNEFTDYFASDSSPQQRNGFDCGVFVCAALEQLSRRDPSHPTFDQDPPILSPQDEDESSDEEEDEDGDEEEEEEAGGGYASRRKRNRGDGYEWNFGQDNMPYMRRRIIYEISQRALLD